MDIRPQEIESTKVVGKLNGKNVILMALKGGLHLHVMAKGNGMEVLAVAPHAVVCRHLSRKKYPDIHFSHLEKSEQIDERHYAHLVPQWEAVTADFEAAAAKRR